MGENIAKKMKYIDQALEQDFDIDRVCISLSRDIKLFRNCLSITLNPADEQQYFDSEHRVEKVQTYVRQLLSKYIPNHILYDFYTEYAKPHDKTASGCSARVHFHGILYLTEDYSEGDFYINVYQHLNVQMKVDVDSIFSIAGWYFYMTKDYNMANYCAYKGIPWHFSERDQRTDKNLQILDEESAGISERLRSTKYLEYGITNNNKYKKK